MVGIDIVNFPNTVLIVVAEHRGQGALAQMQIADDIEGHGRSLSALRGPTARFPPFLAEQRGLLERDLGGERAIVAGHAPPRNVVEAMERGDHRPRSARLAGAQRHLAVREGGPAGDAAHHPGHRALEGGHGPASAGPASRPRSARRSEAFFCRSGMVGYLRLPAAAAATKSAIAIASHRPMTLPNRSIARRLTQRATQPPSTTAPKPSRFDAST